MSSCQTIAINKQSLIIDSRIQMDPVLENIIRQNPKLRIRDAIDLYRQHCQSNAEAISNDNICKITKYFQGMC